MGIAPAPAAALATAYLVAYNVTCALAWLYVDYLLLDALVLRAAGPAGAWPAVAHVLPALQTAALLEVAHAALGLVRGSAFVAFVQVFARLAVLLGFVVPVPTAQRSAAFALMAAAWAAVEVPRYVFYVFGTLDKHAADAADAANVEPPRQLMPYAVKWLRYSLFIPLYPLGIAGELGCYWAAYGAVQRNEPRLDVAMPNGWNIKYSHFALMCFLLALYPIGSWFMIGNMVKARRSALGPAEEQKQRRE